MHLVPTPPPRGFPRRGIGMGGPFDQPGRASEHARTAAPFTGATAQRDTGTVGCTVERTERLSALNLPESTNRAREPGRKSLKNHRARETTSTTSRSRPFSAWYLLHGGTRLARSAPCDDNTALSGYHRYARARSPAWYTLGARRLAPNIARARSPSVRRA
jgi:hypothetical protein